MSDHYFISYSSVDGKDFAIKLADELAAGPPEITVWLDKRDLRPGENWDVQIVEALRTCRGMIFIMTKDSVNPLSICKDEWGRALRYKKPIVPLRFNRDAELPFRLGSREYINFTGSFAPSLARLRKHITWIDSPEGQLQALKDRLADAQRELPRADQDKQLRIQEDISNLEQDIVNQQAIVTYPIEAEKRVQQNIDQGLELERRPSMPVHGNKRSKFINPPPLIAPTWFQDRHVETKIIGDFLKDDALRLITVVGRGGIGKSAMVCRLLRSLESGQLPDEGGPLTIDGIVYLSNARSFHRVNVPDLYAGITNLLSEDTKKHLDAIYKNPKSKTFEFIEALAEAFNYGRTVLMLDNFEDVVDMETGHINDVELDEALQALLNLPPHGLKVIITTRVNPSELALVQPGLQRRLDLDTGLESPFAEDVLRAMDVDGKAGLQGAPENMLKQARQRTRGYPRALEHLFGILSADRDTTLQEILENTEKLLPDKVVEVLVGEAFNRLDIISQRVMQALATYRYPVPPTAIDWLLRSYIPGVESGPILSRLVNMQFVRRDAGRYYLHQIDRDYAINRIPEGEQADRNMEGAPFSRFALQHQAAEWFKMARKPIKSCNTLDDLAAHLAEFELRFEGKDYDTAATLLLQVSIDFLILWGHYRLVIDLHESLLDKIYNPFLKAGNYGNLGTAYFRMGHFQKAINYSKKALTLAREIKDRKGESIWLINLGACLSELGKIGEGSKYYDEALIIHRDIGNRGGEALTLGNLANNYSDLGQTKKAINFTMQALTINREIENRACEALNLVNLGLQYKKLGKSEDTLKSFNKALTIAKDIGYRLIEAGVRSTLGDLHSDQGEWEEAARSYQISIEISDETANSQFQKISRCGLSLVCLQQGNLKMARETAEFAKQIDFPLSNHLASAYLGLVSIFQGDNFCAQKAFTNSINQANRLLIQCPELYVALDIKGFALCGLALCDNLEHIRSAKESFKTARSINSDIGEVKGLLRLFDTLAKVDKDGILYGVRLYAAGENMD